MNTVLTARMRKYVSSVLRWAIIWCIPFLSISFKVSLIFSLFACLTVISTLVFNGARMISCNNNKSTKKID